MEFEPAQEPILQKSCTKDGFYLRSNENDEVFEELFFETTEFNIDFIQGLKNSQGFFLNLSGDELEKFDSESAMSKRLAQMYFQARKEFSTMREDVENALLKEGKIE